MKSPLQAKRDQAKAAKDAREKGKKWLDRVEAAGKLEKVWLDDAEEAVTSYTGETDGKDRTTRGDKYDFNILFANVETIVPAVINSPPAPDIRRRFGDPDPVARIVAEIIERVIRLQVDDSRLQVEMEASAQDAFLAGRGVVRIRFWSDIVGGETTHEELEDAADAAGPGRRDDVERAGLAGGELEPGVADALFPDGDDAGPDLGGVDPRLAIGANGGPALERVENERIGFEAVSWRDYRHGPSKRWDDRSWDAFRFCIPREEEGKSFDQSLIQGQMNDADWNKRVGANDELTGWEIWDKSSRSVIFIDDEGILLKEVEDPLGLSGFFCIATPMQPIEINGRLMPVNPFSVYRRLAKDLDDAVRRKNKLINAMRAKGWYGLSATDMQSVMDLDDNEFAPIEDPEVWAQNGGVEKAIAFWPIERFIVAIQQLDAAIAQYKAWIYEVTGISDIVRGASVAKETATAQSIKSQWGSLRIQKMQRMMERCARDLFVMMSEIIPTKFTPQTLEKMTGIPIVPQPNDPPEAIQQKLGVLQLLKERLATYYRVDVESDSTVRADLTRQKQEVAEFLQGAAAYLSSVGPMIQTGQIPADVAMEIFAANARLFNLGKSVEDVLEQMITQAKAKAQQPQQPTPQQQAEMARAQQEGQQAQLNMAQQQQDMQQRQQEFQMKMAEEARKAQSEGAKAQQQAIMDAMEQELKRIELQTKNVELAIKQEDLRIKQTPPAAHVTVMEGVQ